MANKLEEARKIINEVDAQMAELFVKRMHAAELAYEHKKEYGLPILDALENNISNCKENITRFAVLSKVMANSPALSHSLLMFSGKNEAGSPENAISIIGKSGYHMTALKRMPLQKHSRQHYYYMEIDGPINNDTGTDMIEELRQVCDCLKIAGTFAPHTEI